MSASKKEDLSKCITFASITQFFIDQKQYLLKDRFCWNILQLVQDEEGFSPSL